jgi:SH3 domain-containing YSC84-like protein 1
MLRTLLKEFLAMYRTILAVVVTILFASSICAQQKERARVENAGKVMQEIMNMPEGLPRNLLQEARCVVVIPSQLRVGFFVGGIYGRGVMTCRRGKDAKGPWGLPTMIAAEGGSFGFQAGGQATDFVFLLMNDRAASALLASKVKLGVDVSAAGGPIGRHAEAAVDASMRAAILSYSRSRGLFAGATFNGSTLRVDGEANQRLYGKSVSPKALVFTSDDPTPPSARKLLATLDKETSANPAAATT